MDLERYEAAVTYYNQALSIEKLEFFYALPERCDRGINAV